MFTFYVKHASRKISITSAINEFFMNIAYTIVFTMLLQVKYNSLIHFNYAKLVKRNHIVKIKLLFFYFFTFIILRSLRQILHRKYILIKAKHAQYLNKKIKLISNIENRRNFSV